jgi:alkyl hydroperoxide reductase subunit AhpC
MTSSFATRLNSKVPDFDCITTHGNFKFHDYLKSDANRPWTLFFSHPADFTPVCTTEIGYSETHIERFHKLGIKLIGISCDSRENHESWIKDILFREGLSSTRSKLSFPIISDVNCAIVAQLGMIDPGTIIEGKVPLPARAVFLIDKDFLVRLAWLYPAAVGRSYQEILRAAEAVQISEKYSVATPVEWRPHQPVLLPADSDLVLASKCFNRIEVEVLPSGKDYVRKVKDLFYSLFELIHTRNK